MKLLSFLLACLPAAAQCSLHLTNSVAPGSAVLVYQNGLLKKINVDYTFTNATRTVSLNAWSVGDTLAITYQRIVAYLSATQFATFRDDTTCTTASTVTPPGFINDEIPQGTLDGTNAVFTLLNPPNPPTSLHLYNNGLRLQPIVRDVNGNFLFGDFDLAGATITFGNGGGCGNFQTPASDVATLSGIPGTGDVITITINGIPFTYVVAVGDTMAQVQNGLVAAVSANSTSPVVAAAIAGTNTIAFAALVGGVAGNAYTMSVAVTPGNGVSTMLQVFISSPTFLGGGPIFCPGSVPQLGDLLLGDYRK